MIVLNLKINIFQLFWKFLRVLEHSVNLHSIQRAYSGPVISYIDVEIGGQIYNNNNNNNNDNEDPKSTKVVGKSEQRVFFLTVNSVRTMTMRILLDDGMYLTLLYFLKLIIIISFKNIYKKKTCIKLLINQSNNKMITSFQNLII